MPLLLSVEGPRRTVVSCNGCWGVDVDKAGKPRPKKAGIPLIFNVKQNLVQFLRTFNINVFTNNVFDIRSDVIISGHFFILSDCIAYKILLMYLNRPTFPSLFLSESVRLSQEWVLIIK